MMERPMGLIQAQVRMTKSRRVDPFESMTIMSSGMVEFTRMRTLEEASQNLRSRAQETEHPWLKRLLTMKKNELDREIIASSFLFDTVDL